MKESYTPEEKQQQEKEQKRSLKIGLIMLIIAFFLGSLLTILIIY